MRAQYSRRQAELAARLAEHAASPEAAARLKAFANKYLAKAEKMEAEQAEAGASENPLPPPHVIDGSSDETEQQ